MSRGLVSLVWLAPLAPLVGEFVRGGATPLLVGLSLWWIGSAYVAR